MTEDLRTYIAKWLEKKDAEITKRLEKVELQMSTLHDRLCDLERRMDEISLANQMNEPTDLGDIFSDQDQDPMNDDDMAAVLHDLKLMAEEIKPPAHLSLTIDLSDKPSLKKKK